MVLKVGLMRGSVTRIIPVRNASKERLAPLGKRLDVGVDLSGAT